MNNKETILDTLDGILEARLIDFTRRARETAKEATHEEAKAEDDKDTRALEQTYLARGQAERVAAAQRELQLFRSMQRRSWTDELPIAAGALVQLEDEEEQERSVLLLPLGAGIKLTAGDQDIQVITPTSPLGEALLAKETGDLIEIHLGGRRREWTIVGVT